MDIRPIRFFCIRCGKEIFQLVRLGDIREYTIGEMIDDCECSDCLFKEMGGEPHEEIK